MILSTPNLYSVNNLLRFIRGDGFDNPYEQFSKIEKIGHMGHVREYTVNQVKEFLKKTGFKSLKVEMISYNSFNKLYKPFNLLRKIIPGLHAYQVHVCKKDN